ncbi:MAG: hypothetical protein Q9167_005193 [Letrouitia subvulpina]
MDVTITATGAEAQPCKVEKTPVTSPSLAARREARISRPRPWVQSQSTSVIRNRPAMTTTISATGVGAQPCNDQKTPAISPLEARRAARLSRPRPWVQPQPASVIRNRPAMTTTISATGVGAQPCNDQKTPTTSATGVEAQPCVISKTPTAPSVSCGPEPEPELGPFDVNVESPTLKEDAAAAFDRFVVAYGRSIGLAPRKLRR